MEVQTDTIYPFSLLLNTCIDLTLFSGNPWIELIQKWVRTRKESAKNLYRTTKNWVEGYQQMTDEEKISSQEIEEELTNNFLQSKIKLQRNWANSK